MLVSIVSLQNLVQGSDHAAFATRVREVVDGERHFAQPVASGSAANAPFAAHETLPGRGNWNPATTGAGRIDGVAKVTGAKLYASDFRAADLPGWPADTSHAILVRATTPRTSIPAWTSPA